MSWFVETDINGHTVEGRIGEACCPVCGYPMLAKFSADGEFLALIGRCPACEGVI